MNTTVDVTAGAVTANVPAAILVAAIVAVLLIIGGGVTLIAIYNRIRNGIIDTVKDVIDARITRHEKEELESKDRLLYNFNREVDMLKKDIERVERDVGHMRASMEQRRQ